MKSNSSIETPLSPEARLAEIARTFALGVIRLQRRSISNDIAPIVEVPSNPPNRPGISLEVSDATVLSVQHG